MLYELLQPFINDIIVAIAGLFTVITLAIFTELRKRILTWIDSRNDLRHQEYLKFIADQAFGYVEMTMKDAQSQTKINEAIRFVSKNLEKKKIQMSDEEIRASIEKAILEFKSKSK